GMPNSVRACEASLITRQSESDPITTPTMGAAEECSGSVTSPGYVPLLGVQLNGARYSGEMRGRGACGVDDVVEVVPRDVHVSDLAARTRRFAVGVDLRGRLLGHRRIEPVLESALCRTAEDVDHRRPGCTRRR